MRDPKALVPERVFQLHVLEYAVTFGWKAMHISDSRRSYSKGFPDCVFAKADRVIFAELKAMNGKLSEAQEQWGNVLIAGPAEYYLWRPDDWESIEQILGPDGAAAT